MQVARDDFGRQIRVERHGIAIRIHEFFHAMNGQIGNGEAVHRSPGRLVYRICPRSEQLMYTSAERKQMRILLLLWCAVGAVAQSQGSITGSIVNLPGEAVANAPVEATSVSTKAVFKLRARIKVYIR